MLKLGRADNPIIDYSAGTFRDASKIDENYIGLCIWTHDYELRLETLFYFTKDAIDMLKGEKYLDYEHWAYSNPDAILSICSTIYGFGRDTDPDGPKMWGHESVKIYKQDVIDYLNGRNH